VPFSKRVAMPSASQPANPSSPRGPKNPQFRPSPLLPPTLTSTPEQYQLYITSYSLYVRSLLGLKQAFWLNATNAREGRGQPSVRFVEKQVEVRSSASKAYSWSVRIPTLTPDGVDPSVLEKVEVGQSSVTPSQRVVLGVLQETMAARARLFLEMNGRLIQWPLKDLGNYMASLQREIVDVSGSFIDRVLRPVVDPEEPFQIRPPTRVTPETMPIRADPAAAQARRKAARRRQRENRKARKLAAAAAALTSKTEVVLAAAGLAKAELDLGKWTTVLKKKTQKGRKTFPRQGSSLGPRSPATATAAVSGRVPAAAFVASVPFGTLGSSPVTKAPAPAMVKGSRPPTPGKGKGRQTPTVTSPGKESPSKTARRNRRQAIYGPPTSADPTISVTEASGSQ